MQIVIKLPEEKYNMIRNKTYCGIYDAEVYEAIAKGTPLPKGHGRLKDVDELKTKYGGWYNLCNGKSIHAVETKEIDWMPTIIEADKAESGG